jgi:hypothetical protein
VLQARRSNKEFADIGRRPRSTTRRLCSGGSRQGCEESIGNDQLNGKDASRVGPRQTSHLIFLLGANRQPDSSHRHFVITCFDLIKI